VDARRSDERPSLHQTQRDGIAVGDALARLDGGNERHDEPGYEERNAEKNPDEDQPQDETHDRRERDRDVEVQCLLRLCCNEVGLIALGDRDEEGPERVESDDESAARNQQTRERREVREHPPRSEERRVGKDGILRWRASTIKKK